MKALEAEGAMQVKAWKKKNAWLIKKTATLWHLEDTRRGIQVVRAGQIGGRDGGEAEGVLGQTVPLCGGFGLY